MFPARVTYFYNISQARAESALTKTLESMFIQMKEMRKIVEEKLSSCP